MWLGAHIGIADGLVKAPQVARSLGCESMQIFSKSPQMWKGVPIADEVAAGFVEAVRAEGLKATAVHHSYLINLASPKRSTLGLSRRTFVDELGRAEKLGVDFLIFHPGAHLKAERSAGFSTLVESLNWAFEQTPGLKVRALLENAAGQGSALCSTLEELADVMSRIVDPGRAGVAIDTCHLFASGVDFRSDADYGRLMDRIGSTVGVATVRAFHLNDAKAELGSHLDRHENIGQGQIGVDGFRHLVNDPRWEGTPGMLETPLDEHDYEAYARDLATLRGLRAAAPSPAEEGPKARTKARRAPTPK